MADWIVPCNPGYYDVFGAFDSLDTVDWRQTAKSIEPGDHMYIYIGAPVQAVAFRCQVLDTLIPSELADRSDERFNLGSALDENFNGYVYMRLKLDRKIPTDQITLQKMRSYGLKGNIQSARRVPEELRELFD